MKKCLNCRKKCPSSIFYSYPNSKLIACEDCGAISAFRALVTRALASFVILFLMSSISFNLSHAYSAGEAPDLNLVIEDVAEYWLRAHTERPVYPRRALERGQQGCAVFSFIIGRNGRAENIELFEERPKGVFAENARKALQHYRWRAAPSNQALWPVRTVMQLKFELEGKSKYKGVYGWSECDKLYPVYSNEPKVPEKHRDCDSRAGSRLLKSCP